MANQTISIIDYGLGNLKSVSRAFEALGKSVKIVNTPPEIRNADYLVIPGVGAFSDGMKGLQQRGLVEPIIDFAKQKKPLLGICLGMQLLMTESEEFGLHKGLNLISGRVVPLKSPKQVNEEGYKVPNYGWHDLLIQNGHRETFWENSVLKEIKPFSEVYFVHSYYVIPENIEDSLAIIKYGSQNICAVIKKENISGCQFHPEKSGKIGLEILNAFCQYE